MHWSRSSLLQLKNRASKNVKKEVVLSLRESTIIKKDYFFLEVDKKYILRPESTFKIMWDVLIIVLIVNDLYMVPIILVYPDSSLETLVFFEKIPLMFYAVDVIITLNTGFYEKGHMTSDRKRIFIQYLKGFLIVDILSLVPLNLCLNYSYVETLQWFLRFYRVIKVYKFTETLFILLRTQLAMCILYYSKIVLIISLLLHWLTCLWDFISDYNLSHDFGTWNLTTSDTYNIMYLKSFYYVLVTTSTIGYGDYYPSGINQTIIALIVLIIGVMIFSFNITIFIDKVILLKKKKISFFDKLINLNAYMKKNQIPNSLKYKLRRYLHYSSMKDEISNINENKILSYLSDPLREQIFGYTAGGKMIQRCQVFLKIYEGKVIRKLSKFIASKVFGPHEIIIQEGELSSQVYFILSGNIVVFHKATGTQYKNLKSDDYFGEIGFFTRKPRTAVVQCTEISEVLCISRDDLDKVLYKFPVAAAATRTLELQCLDNDYSVLGVKCYLCSGDDHIASNCSYTVINPENLELPQKWVKKRSSSRSINPRSYYVSSSPRRSKKPKVVKMRTLADDKNEEDKYGELMKKITLFRSEDEQIDTPNIAFTENYVGRILTSEEEIDSSFNVPVKNIKNSKFSILICSENCSENSSENSDQF